MYQAQWPFEDSSTITHTPYQHHLKYPIPFLLPSKPLLRNAAGVASHSPWGRWGYTCCRSWHSPGTPAKCCRYRASITLTLRQRRLHMLQVLTQSRYTCQMLQAQGKHHTHLEADEVTHVAGLDTVQEHLPNAAGIGSASHSPWGRWGYTCCRSWHSPGTPAKCCRYRASITLTLR